MIYDRCNLVKIIRNDLFSNGKYLLILLFLTEIFALLVVLITYQTKQLIIVQEQLLLEQEELDIERRNLIVKKNILASNDRVEYIALRDLHMQYVDPDSEVILFLH
ncbi:cell division protein FtsL [Blochmannia endosymbiont of Colobopsis nipponica]|uniref:cell division protein FtsL n=1 Tax=Blochmannia endosymbiont of Colobopsis nipponica TaxID=2681987 RepID=UPI00177ED768|nr:cell division protein FtsL [Blochmannia endosymbiont of Colobopsis nipponica]QOI11273.1 cell division protein FtsL [Blochmannia endosymbiont of Colobopsis nipponica]